MSAPTARPDDATNRWVVLAALYLGYASFGMVHVSFAPLIAPIRADLGLSQSAMGLILGTWTMIYIGAAIPAGAMLDRLGTRRGIGIGIALIALSGIARAFAVDFASLFFAVTLFGLGGPLISIGSPKLISQLFDATERPTAVGIYLTAPSLGAAISLSASNSVLMPLFDQSWRLTLATYGGFAAAAAVAWLLIARERNGPRPTGGDKAQTGWAVFAGLGKSRVVQVLLGMALASFLFNHALNNWLPEMLRARGFEASAAGLWATLPIGVGILGGIFITRLATPPRRVPMLRMGFLILVTAPFLLAFAEGPGLILGLVLLGIGRIISGVIMLVLMEAPGVGARNMGAAGGLYFTAGEVGGVLGPTMIGVMADLSGGFTAGLVVLAGVAAGLLALTFALRFALARGDS